MTSSEGKSPSASSPGNSSTERRIRALRDGCSEVARRCDKKRRVYLAAGVALVVLSIACLARVTSLLFQLDAHALTQIGRIEFEKRLPEGRIALESHLKYAAPDIVRAALLGTLEFLPAARQSLADGLNSRLDAVTDAYVKELGRELLTRVGEARREVDAELPGSSDEEKLAALTTKVADSFKRGISGALDALYPQYRREMDRVTAYLKSLSQAEHESLPPKERLHRELIQTLLRLVVLERTRRS